MQERKQPLIKNESLLCFKDIDSMFICTTTNCKETAFICSNRNCPCYTEKHHKCSINSRVYILNSLEQLRQELSQQNKTSLQYILKIYDQLIDQLSQQRNKFVQSIQMFGLSANLRKFINLINDGLSKQIDGNFGSIVKEDIESLKQRPQIIQNAELIKSSWEKDKKQFEKIIKNLQNFSNSFQQANQYSTILQPLNFVQIRKFFNKKIRSFVCIYRASQNNFSSQLFHKNCDGIPNNLTVLKNQFGRIIGGFTPLQWNSKTYEQAKYDQTNQSFLFSLNLNKKFPIKTGQVAIYHNSSFGPLFGYTGNLAIADNCNERTNWVQFNTSYDIYPYNNEKTFLNDFVGSNAGNYFKIIDYEFYQLTFYE